MDTGVLTVSDTLDVHPFPIDGRNTIESQEIPSPIGDDAIRARLADVARQEEKRHSLSAFFEKDAPAWNPDDHPEIDAAGGAAAWVRKMRSGTEQESGPADAQPSTRYLGDLDFFKSKSLAELASEQGVGPVKDIRVFAGGIPDDEDVDTLIAQLEEMRGA